MKRGMDASVYIIWKKCLAFIMAAVLVLTSVDVTVFATEPGEEIKKVGKEEDFGELTTGTYQLTGDINLTKRLLIDDNETVKILFDGHTLKQTTSDCIIKNLGTLILGDENDRGGTITGAARNVIQNGSGWAAVKYEGNLTNYVTISGNSNGRGVYNEKGTFINYGKICNNTGVNDDDGGGVYNCETFINYGEICNNTTKYDGGGVWNGGTFTNCRKICNNTAADDGGGVFNYGTFKNCGEICNNTAGTVTADKGHGGGVYNMGSSEFKIFGPAIVSGNTSEAKEDNVPLVAETFGAKVPKITISGPLDSNSRIGVSTGYLDNPGFYHTGAGVVTNDYSKYVDDPEVKCFFPDEVQGQGYMTVLNNSGEVELIQHSHSWEYETSGDTIKAYCKKNKNSQYCPYYGSDNAVTISLQAENADYSTEPYSGATLEGEERFKSITGAKVSEITYEGITYEGITYVSSNEPPTDLGSYTATVTVEAGGNTYPLTKNFTISKKTPMATVVMNDYTFGETVSNPELAEGSDSDYDHSAKIEYQYKKVDEDAASFRTWPKEGITATTLEPGNYKMRAILYETDSYERYITEAVAFQVTEANMSNKVSANGFTGTYDGQEHSIQVTAPDGAEVKYKTTESEEYNLESPEFKDAGEYTVYYQVTKKDIPQLRNQPQ